MIKQSPDRYLSLDNNTCVYILGGILGGIHASRSAPSEAMLLVSAATQVVCPSDSSALGSPLVNLLQGEISHRDLMGAGYYPM